MRSAKLDFYVRRVSASAPRAWSADRGSYGHDSATCACSWS